MESFHQNNEELPKGLALLAGNRDLVTTTELAKAFNISSQTVRKNYCLTGNCYGIKPTKLGNKLLWPVEKIALRLKGVL
jgi:hypothetical protein